MLLARVEHLTGITRQLSKYQGSKHQWPLIITQLRNPAIIIQFLGFFENSLPGGKGEDCFWHWMKVLIDWFVALVETLER